MTEANGPGASLVGRTLFPWAMLAYFLLGPPVAGTVFLSILAFGTMSAGQWAEALPPFIGITYLVAGLPALITAIVAAILSATARWWLRLGVPAAAALISGIAAVWLIVRLGDPPEGTLLVAAAISSLAGALLPGLLLELLRNAGPAWRSTDRSGSRGNSPPTGG